MIYKNWNISYWAKPIPIRNHDWEATHEDYDPTPIHSYGPPTDDRFITAASLEDIKKDIDDWENEE